jgi:hypothetical protein
MTKNVLFCNNFFIMSLYVIFTNNYFDEILAHIAYHFLTSILFCDLILF